MRGHRRLRPACCSAGEGARPQAAGTVGPPSRAAGAIRPALSDERVQLNAAGQVELKLMTPWRDGIAYLVMSPLEFMQRLAALVPRPRLHLIRFHGVPAPNVKLRALVLPQGPADREELATEADSAAEYEVEKKSAHKGQHRDAIDLGSDPNPPCTKCRRASGPCCRSSSTPATPSSSRARRWAASRCWPVSKST
ncbi:MAG: transposase [Burkholderiales bacterium]|nr:transposase [Burkholderiales bacterium]MDE1926291.1 transposase [Burkholderiales bacterium]MDE2158197.1 transposase [Burkholderiales bacterium]MDE2502626.1 transposase [Burkholderiales bacterium]